MFDLIYFYYTIGKVVKIRNMRKQTNQQPHTFVAIILALFDGNRLLIDIVHLDAIQRSIVLVVLHVLHQRLIRLHRHYTTTTTTTY
jgi:hypothetical protein